MRGETAFRMGEDAKEPMLFRFLTSPADIKMKKQQAKVVGDVPESQAYILGYSCERNSAATLRESFLSSYDCYPLMADRWPDEVDAPGYRQAWA